MIILYEETYGWVNNYTFLEIKKRKCILTLAETVRQCTVKWSVHCVVSGQVEKTGQMQWYQRRSKLVDELIGARLGHLEIHLNMN